jgi:cytochrome c-type biogenesis protein CcmH/NrfG
MKPESFVFAIAGIFFGIIVGWILGSQQAATSRVATAPPAQQAPAATGAQAEPSLDATKVQALESVANQNPNDAEPRVQLGNLYFDAERYTDAITWYEAAHALKPSDPNVSTDLGVAYYYTNQPDRAIAQFEKSLAADPNHTKTLLNIGIVKAFGKQDYEGAAQAWQQVVAIAPNSPEGQAASKGLEGLRNSNRNTPGGPGGR